MMADQSLFVEIRALCAAEEANSLLFSRLQPDSQPSIVVNGQCGLARVCKRVDDICENAWIYFELNALVTQVMLSDLANTRSFELRAGLEIIAHGKVLATQRIQP